MTEIDEVLAGSRKWAAVVGDCRTVMAGLPEGSVDAIVCDPPYGLEFMGKEWDAPWKDAGLVADVAAEGGAQDGNGGNAYSRSRVRYQGGAKYKGGRPSEASDDLVKNKYLAHGVTYDREPSAIYRWHLSWATEALRVLKPGGHLLAMGGPRTVHRLTSAIEDAGFEIRDMITWHFGSGFPKSRNVTEALLSSPPCRCGVPKVSGESAPVESGSPSVGVGTRVRAESGAVPTARFPADQTGGVGTESESGTDGGFREMDPGLSNPIGQRDPVVLRPFGMAPPTEGDEIGHTVGVVKTDPEALRYEVMGQQAHSSAAVQASSVAPDHRGGDAPPASATVLPLASAPGRIERGGESSMIVEGHAESRAVRSSPQVGSEAGLTDAAHEDPVASSDHDASERMMGFRRCDRCGGVIGTIPPGLGSALKPATEMIVVARKPFDVTVAENVLRYGTGALNIDATRVGFAGPGDREESTTKNAHADFGSGPRENRVYGEDLADRGKLGNWSPPGRWPPNLVLTHAPGCRQVGTKTVEAHAHYPEGSLTGYGANLGAETGGQKYRYDAEGPRISSETVEAWECADGCPVTEMDRQSGESESTPHRIGELTWSDLYYGGRGIRMTRKGGSFSDAGGASRFFPTFGWDVEEMSFLYEPKASRSEREAGLRVPDGSDDHTLGPMAGRGDGIKPVGLRCRRCGKWKVSGSPCVCADPDFERVPFNRPAVANTHPTVKPIALMRWLVRLVTPPGGVVLDPFAGSGSTGCGAVPAGFRFIGLEQDAGYAEIARQRIAYWERKGPKERPNQNPLLKRKSNGQRKLTEPGVN